MADFLSDEWFATLNETLKVAGPAPIGEGPATFRIVFEFTDAPSALPHAMTFTLSREGVSVDAGDHLMADAMIKLTFSDAEALINGTSDSATALREGRIKLRGDITALLPLLDWLIKAHPAAH